MSVELLLDAFVGVTVSTDFVTFINYPMKFIVFQL